MATLEATFYNPSETSWKADSRALLKEIRDNKTGFLKKPNKADFDKAFRTGNAIIVRTVPDRRFMGGAIFYRRGTMASGPSLWEFGSVAVVQKEEFLGYSLMPRLARLLTLRQLIFDGGCQVMAAVRDDEEKRNEASLHQLPKAGYRIVRDPAVLAEINRVRPLQAGRTIFLFDHERICAEANRLLDDASAGEFLNRDELRVLRADFDVEVITDGLLEDYVKERCVGHEFRATA